MDVHKDLLPFINTKYVLLMEGHSYSLVDLSTRTELLLDDPILNLQKLFELMIDRGCKVYSRISDLPPATMAKPSEPRTYQVFIKKVYDQQGVEVGSILSALVNSAIGSDEKELIEHRMEDYAFNVLYLNEGLNLFHSTYDDTAALCVIKNINKLPYEYIGGEERTLFDW